MKVADAGLMLLSGLCLAVGSLAAIVYPVARVYLLAESFAGLRSVDEGVYRTVEWTGFIPHAG